ncbi:hypothetical protein CDAR_609141 [Caerostris darwini]|uniref:Uncharacterized protein n=1 Tax=Caerostris darwini TaxID=1538125 RepID=A0AAV4U439_9ARAC|nr:hypothetical protein CDAR_609141 [Caerostris darwini]
MVNGIAVSLPSLTQPAMLINVGTCLSWCEDLGATKECSLEAPLEEWQGGRRKITKFPSVSKSITSLKKIHREVIPAKTSSLTEPTYSVLLPSFKNNLLDTPFHFLPPSELAATATSPPGDSATVFWEPSPPREEVKTNLFCSTSILQEQLTRYCLSLPSTLGVGCNRNPGWGRNSATVFWSPHPKGGSEVRLMVNGIAVSLPSPTHTAMRINEVTPAKTSSLTEATFSVLLPSFKDNLLDTPFPFLPPSELAATATSPPGDSATVFWEPPGRK